MDLTDICKYLKCSVIPHTSKGFVIHETFRQGLSNQEALDGIDAFRNFLYEFYDTISNNKELFTTKKSAGYKPNDTINGSYPIISKAAEVLYGMGVSGTLNATPETVDLFDLLSDKMNGRTLLNGLKLMALAQANIRNKPHEYEKTFMRGDFHPLASAKPVKQSVNISEFVESSPPKTKEFVLEMDNFLTVNECKVESNLNRFRGSCSFTYTSQKLKLNICFFQISIKGLEMQVELTHKQDLQNTLLALPKDARNEYLSKARKFCGEPNCVSGNIPIEIEGEVFKLRCRGYITNNPEPEQLQFIEQFIKARLEYISTLSKDDLSGRTKYQCHTY